MRSTLDTGTRVARATSATLMRRSSRFSRKNLPTEAMGVRSSAKQWGTRRVAYPKKARKLPRKQGFLARARWLFLVHASLQFGEQATALASWGGLLVEPHALVQVDAGALHVAE